MARAHYIVPTAPTRPPVTARLGVTGAAWTDKEAGKFVKLAAESQFNLSALGDDIDGVVTSVESAPSNGFSVGGVEIAVPGDVMAATADGTQAAQTGNLAIGDIVNVGTVVAKDTALTTQGPRVCKATTPANVLARWRVISLGVAGTGAPGTNIVIQRV